MVGQFLLDVDDFMFGAVQQELNRSSKKMMSKYTFGKWVEQEVDFVGRHVKELEDRVMRGSVP